MQTNLSLITVLLFIAVIPLASAQYMGANHPDTIQEREETNLQKDLILTIDKSLYIPGNRITMTFQSETFYDDRTIDFEFITPSGKIATQWYIATMDTDEIQYVFELGRADFKERGTYTIIATYDNVTSETEFILNIPTTSETIKSVPLIDSPGVFEGENPEDFANERMIKELQAENVKLNSRLDSLAEVLNAQTQVLLQLSKDIRDLKNTIGEFFSFEVFA